MYTHILNCASFQVGCGRESDFQSQMAYPLCIERVLE